MLSHDCAGRNQPGNDMRFGIPYGFYCKEQQILCATQNLQHLKYEDCMDCGPMPREEYQVDEINGREKPAKTSSKGSPRDEYERRDFWTLLESYLKFYAFDKADSDFRCTEENREKDQYEVTTNSRLGNLIQTGNKK